MPGCIRWLRLRDSHSVPYPFIHSICPARLFSGRLPHCSSSPQVPHQLVSFEFFLILFIFPHHAFTAILFTFRVIKALTMMNPPNTFCYIPPPPSHSKANFPSKFMKYRPCNFVFFLYPRSTQISLRQRKAGRKNAKISLKHLLWCLFDCGKEKYLPAYLKR